MTVRLRLEVKLCLARVFREARGEVLLPSHSTILIEMMWGGAEFDENGQSLEQV